MGIYLNPGNRGFWTILNGNYVDKTGLIDFVNHTINTPQKLTCFSRPRRFGKSFAAKMLCAYYDKSCDSHSLFNGLEISNKASYEKYLNKYNVIYLDVTWFISRSKNKGGNVVLDLQMAVIDELRQSFKNCINKTETFLPDALLSVSKKTGNQFIIIIDEWDALFREAKTDETLQKDYVQLLRGLFKSGTATDDSIAAAYMTGILPIKKYGTESALTDFREFTMVAPDALAPYVGFTEQEVRILCQNNNLDFEEMKLWYDGYSFENVGSVYSPNSVMQAIERIFIRNYWTQTETFESLKNYIEENYDGLKDAIIMMLGGQSVDVDISTFQNDIVSYKSKDDVLTLLIHLGYFAYNQTTKTIRIPNREVAEVFQSATKGEKWNSVTQAIKQSEQLLNATINGDCEQVAASLELIHEDCTSALKYNDENSLACAIYIAYYTARNYYMIIREFPTGKGFADYAFIPRKGTDKPAMLIELKYDNDSDTAIKQIKEKRYAGKLKEYYGNIIMVGINYDKTTKHHSCIIEQG